MPKDDENSIWFEGLLSLDKTIKRISMSEDTILEFDLLYGWHGENC